MLSSACLPWTPKRLTAFIYQFPKLYAFLLGSLFPMGFAPYNAWILTICSLVGYFGLLQSIRTTNITSHTKSTHSLNRARFYIPFKPLFVTSFCYCLGLFCVGISWIHISVHVYGESPLSVSLLITGAMIMVMSLLVSLVMACFRFSITPALDPIVFACLWVLGEMVRSMLLTGFPWLLLGYAFIDSPLAGFAPVIGVYGLSLVASLCAAELSTILNQPSMRKRLRSAIAVGLLFFGGYLLQFVHWTRPLADSIAVTLIQGNIDQRIKWDESEQQNTLITYRQMTEQWLHSAQQTAAKPATLVVWPEAAIPMFYHEADAYIEQTSKMLAASGVSWITGIPMQHDDGEYAQYFNSVIAAGLGSGQYNKQKLVPFGEFIPFPNVLRTLGRILQWPIFDLPMSSFSVGSASQAPLLAGSYRVAPFICYEIVYPDLVRAATHESDLLLTISNDGWFGESIAPHQHFEMARMRALETGKMLIRATNTGISGLIDHRGQVIMQLPSFQRTYGSGEIHPTEGKTPFMWMGNIPLYWGVVLILLFNFRHLLLNIRSLPWKYSIRWKRKTKLT